MVRSFYNPEQPIRLVVSDFDGTVSVPSEVGDEAYLVAQYSNIQARVPLGIVTSADPAKVWERLNGHGEAGWFLKPLVRGFAQKHVLTEWPSYVPEYVHFSGLERKIYTRRGHYVQTLHELMNVHAANWCNLLVVGDIAELDLAMPVTMGAYGLLIRGPNTSRHELAWATTHPRVQVIDSMHDILTVLDAPFRST